MHVLSLRNMNNVQYVIIEGNLSVHVLLVAYSKDSSVPGEVYAGQKHKFC